jgi:hypothetical protein
MDVAAFAAWLVRRNIVRVGDHAEDIMPWLATMTAEEFAAACVEWTRDFAARPPADDA